MLIQSLRIVLVLLVTLLSVSSSYPAEKTQDKKEVGGIVENKNQDASKPVPITINISGSTQSVDNSNHLANSHKEPESWLDKLWSDPVATFTAALFLATIGLIITGVIQWRALRDTVKAMRADFASTHRPKIRVRHIWPVGDLWEGGTFAINTQIVNVGLTKAKITEYSATTLIVPNDRQLPAVPHYGYCIIVRQDPFLESGQSTDLPPMTEQIRSITQEDNDAIRGNRKTLYCFGYVRYEDSESRLRTTAFCRRLEVPTGIGSYSKLGRFVRLDPENEDYEYQD